LKRALFTGGTGFVGRNVLPVLREHFEILAPTRAEIDLRSEESVRTYLKMNPVNIVFHCANPNPVKNPRADTDALMSEDSLRIFLNLYRCQDQYEKMIYLGSGAEYDKQLEIRNVREEERFRSVPKDSYGFAKYTIDLIARQSEKMYNLCLFACYGPTDHESKFITHCIRCCLRDEPITIRQDCRFDYIHVSDLGRMMAWMGDSQPKRHVYNVSGCQHTLLSEIAQEVRTQMRSGHPIKILFPGFAREYTADGSRFWEESKLRPVVSLQEGIALQIQWEKEHFE